MSAATRPGLATMAGAGVLVQGLSVTGPSGILVEPVDFEVAPGRCLAIIGESGSGKSMTARAMTGLLPGGVVASGVVAIGGRTLELPTSEREWQAIRGVRAVLLLQDPFTSLSPVHRCGSQIASSVEARLRNSRSDVRRGRRGIREEVDAEVRERLAEVNLPERVARMYPHELSGGMRQRVAIAAALATDPDLLIADEPTTALDASNQGEILDLLRELQRNRSMSMLLISHDLGLVRGRADDVLVMRTGEVVERGTVEAVLESPRHEYTRMLLEANPRLDDLAAVAEAPTIAGETVLDAVGLAKTFGGHSALSGVSVRVAPREIVAVVGESGSGKSTLARCIAGLDRPDAGTMRFEGADLPYGRRGRTPDQVQIVFQDPYSTLNPMMTVEQALAEALGAANRPSSDVAELLEMVGLDAALRRRRPAKLSGGQRQRVAIARALAPRPRLLLCDESVSALDAAVQAQILDLLADLRDRLGLSVLFISHDLAVVGRLSDRVYVLNRGRVVEEGPTSSVLHDPADPYTRMLVAAARRENA